MCSSAYHTINICFFDVKIDVQSVHYIQIIAFSKEIINHLDVRVSFLLVFCRVTTYLDPGAIERSILVLVWAYKDDLLEPLQASLLT